MGLIDEGTVQRLIDRQVTLERELDELRDRVRILETWAQEPLAPFAGAPTRLSQIEAKLELALRRSKGDPGPPGKQGIPGRPGRDGTDGKHSDTVIREVKISG